MSETRPDRNLAMELARVTEAAALAAGRWIGHGDKNAADAAAVDAMRLMVDTVSMDGSPHAASAAEVEASSFELADRQETALDELEAREIGTAIERAIARLRPEYRSCIMLRHIEGRSYEEIAATLDLPLGTVKTYIHRARNELRQHLAHLRE